MGAKVNYTNNWSSEERFEHKKEADIVLAKVKKARRNKKYRIVRIDRNTVKEVEVKDE